MTANKHTIHEFMDAFNVLDHKRILTCVTDDAEWVAPGLFHRKGKAEFDMEIENPAFEGKPEITVTRITEEKDIVIAEGHVKTKKKGEPPITGFFCDVFEMRHGKIKKLTSYLMFPPEASS